MKLSVIIVNYNVRHFLEQCLVSVQSALRAVPGEVIVVDNDSVDDSVGMVRRTFPDVECIASKVNLGFSKANNLGAARAKGEYVLLLNPDTIVEEDGFAKCIAFMDAHPEAGALGVKMVDGSGRFLPESKRGFPGFRAAFCKMTGLYKLFPKSAFFNAYYLGHLDPNATHEADVLSGAFMLIRKSVWDQVQGLDEDYFMYGEDIDLSYKIRKAGYENYYFPQTQIIHYKGESTSKGSLNYVVAFYQAMIIFAKKHFAGSNKFALIGMLSAMVWLKALLSSVQNGIGRLRFVLLDLAFFISGFYAIRYYWAWWYHGRVDYFNHQAIHFNLGLFALIWAGSFYFQGVYDKKYALKDLLMAAIWGFAMNLMFYALFPENWRSSRMLLVLSFFWVLAYALLSRLLHNRIRFRSWIIGSDFKRNTLVVGDQSQREKVQALLNPKLESFELHYEEPEEAIRFSTEHWKDYLRIHHIREIIFCQKNLNWKQIVGIMTGLKAEVEYKIMTESGTGIIGSSSRHDRGEIYSLDLEYNLSQRVYLRQKRLFDVLFSIVLLGFSWMLVFIYRNKRRFMTNLIQVGYGRYSWVSYQGQQESRRDLPMIKPGVLFPVEAVEHLLTPELEAQLLTMYAWNYSVWSDLGICLRDFQKLDQIPYGSIH